MSRPSTHQLVRSPAPGAERRVHTPAGMGAAPAIVALRFALPKPAPATISVRSSEGRVVRTLLHGTLEAGEHDCRWDGRDDLGDSVPAGSYILELEAGGSPLTSRRVTVR